MKDIEPSVKDTSQDIEPLYREWRTTQKGMRYMVSSHRPLHECANVVMQKAIDFSRKSNSTK